MRYRKGEGVRNGQGEGVDMEGAEGEERRHTQVVLDVTRYKQKQKLSFLFDSIVTVCLSVNIPVCLSLCLSV